jgi:hypothetical protein
LAFIYRSLTRRKRVTFSPQAWTSSLQFTTFTRSEMKAQTWTTGPKAWGIFVDQHPELGYKPGRMNFHNFLRLNREALRLNDAIRLAKNKFWIAEVDKFCDVAFQCATGVIDVEALNEDVSSTDCLEALQFAKNGGRS